MKISEGFDLTEKNQESKRNFHLFVESANVGIIVTQSVQFKYINQAMLDLVGYSVQEIMAHSFWEIAHEDYREGIKCNYLRRISGESLDHISIVKICRKDKSIKWVEINSIEIDWEGAPSILNFITDITECKQEEADLKKLSLRLDLATSAGSVGVWEYDIVNNILIWDDLMYVLYGQDRKKFGGAYEAWVLCVHPDDVRQADAEFHTAIDNKSEFDTVFRVIWPDGSVHLIKALGSLQSDLPGNSHRMFGTNWDVSEQKNTESILIVAKDEKEIANRAKMEFLSNMGHEIRTPLNSVIGFSDMLLKTTLSALQKQYAKNVNSSGHLLLDIFNEILDYSRLEEGEVNLDKVKTDLILLAEQISDTIHYDVFKKGIAFLLNLQPDMPRIAMADPVRLKQILVNLLGNALKFTESGEIEFKISFDRIDEKFGKYHFSVRDTGIGIDQERQKQLFNPFFQADSSSTRKFGGVGLGLTISNMLAKKMESKIEMLSEPDQGSEFFFSVKTEYESDNAQNARRPTTVKRVLIIDRNHSNRLILKNMLFNWGIECAESEDETSSLELIKESDPFDVLLIDYQRPALNDPKTIKMLRDNLMFLSAIQPVIMMHTLSDDIDIVEECNKMGVKITIAKPVKSDELYYCLESAHNQTIPSQWESHFNFHAPDTNPLGVIAPVILVAEDQSVNMLLINSLICQLIPGVHILKAKNGEEAIQMAIFGKPDLIIMDIQMPVKNGIEATVEIRKQEKPRGYRTPIVALTASSIKGEREKCLEAGMDDFLTKPLNPDKLNNVIERYLTPFVGKYTN